MMDKDDQFGSASAPEAPYIYQFPGQKDDPIPGIGVCDTSGIESDATKLASLRFATGHIRFTNAAGVLTAASGQLVKLFTKGVGDNTTEPNIGGGLVLTKTETNAFKDGALVANDGTHFRVLALQVYIGQMALYSAGLASVADAEWMHTGVGYQRTAQALVRDYGRIYLEQVEGETARELGLVNMFPSMMGGGSSQYSSSNGEPIAGAIIPLRAAVRAGAKNTTTRPAVTITLDRPLTVGLRTDPALADAVIPVRVDLLGYVAAGSASSAPATDPMDKRVLDGIMAQQRQQGAVLAQLAQAVTTMTQSLTKGG
jgi:hypothetical protein